MNHPINEQSHVLEIGPGPGSLTLELLRTGAKVTAIELDQNLQITLLEFSTARMENCK